MYTLILRIKTEVLYIVKWYWLFFSVACLFGIIFYPEVTGHFFDKKSPYPAMEVAEIIVAFGFFLATVIGVAVFTVLATIERNKKGD